MSARHHFLVSIAATLALASCKPVNGNILNGTGQDTYVVVKGVNGNTLAYGTLKQGTALSMEQHPRELSEIAYRATGNSECKMDQEEIERAMRQGDDIWVIEIIPC